MKWLAGLSLLCVLTIALFSADVPLAWDPNPETNVIGYDIWNFRSNSWHFAMFTTSTMATPKVPTGVHPFAVDAVNDRGLTSVLSAPVTAIVLRVQFDMQASPTLGTGAQWRIVAMLTNYVVATQSFFYRAVGTIQ